MTYGKVMGTYPLPGHVQFLDVSMSCQGCSNNTYIRQSNNNKYLVLSPHKRECTSGYISYLGTYPTQYDVYPKEDAYLLNIIRIVC